MIRKPPRYEQFIHYLFDRPVTEPEWYFSLDNEEFNASEEELADLYISTFENCTQDFSSFSDEQISLGLNYMFHNTCSDMMFFIRDGTIPEKRKIDIILSIKHLYEGCFSTRCKPVLCWTNERSGNALNGACYMLWDFTPINYLPEEQRKDRSEYFVAILEVLEHALYLPNDACVESGLHGLGHMHHEYPGHVTEIIDSFLIKKPDIRSELLQYAQNARQGYVQ